MFIRTTKVCKLAQCSRILTICSFVCVLLFYLGVIRRVKLNNPIHFRYIQAPRCYISAQQCSRTGIAKLKKCGGTFLLLLLSLEEKICWSL